MVDFGVEFGDGVEHDHELAEPSSDYTNGFGVLGAKTIYFNNIGAKDRLRGLSLVHEGLLDAYSESFNLFSSLFGHFLGSALESGSLFGVKGGFGGALGLFSLLSLGFDGRLVDLRGIVNEAINEVSWVLRLGVKFLNLLLGLVEQPWEHVSVEDVFSEAVVEEADVLHEHKGVVFQVSEVLL